MKNFIENPKSNLGLGLNSITNSVNPQTEVAVIGDELQGFHFILRIVNKNHNFLSNIFVEFFLSCQKAEDIVGALNKLEMSFSRIPDDFQQAQLTKQGMALVKALNTVQDKH